MIRTLRFLTILFLAISALYGGLGVHSDTAVSQQGVGFRATVRVFNGSTENLATLHRDRAGIMGLSNPFQTAPNGRFTFFAAAGWYDLVVSGVGVTQYQYTIYVTDGTFSISGQAGGDLSGQYPSPVVAGIGGKAVPTMVPQDGEVPSYNLSDSNWSWRLPLYSLATGAHDVVGVYPNLRVGGIWDRAIDNTTPPNEGDTLRYRGVTGKWRYETMSTIPSSMTFNLCVASPCTPQNNAAPQYIVTSSIQVTKCWITANVVPQGQSLVVDIVKVGSTSIFSSGLTNKLSITSLGGVVEKDPPAPVVAGAGSAFTVNILQVGTSVAGQNITVSCQIVGN
jgi:hypothetical protein